MVRDIRGELGGRIRRARRQRLGMPLDEFGRRLAEMLGRPRAFSNVTASNWETGRQEPSWEALVAIARLAGLPLEYFAGVGELEDYPPAPGGEGRAEPPEPRLRTLLAAALRSDAAERRLIASQIESLLATLREGP